MRRDFTDQPTTARMSTQRRNVRFERRAEEGDDRNTDRGRRRGDRVRAAARASAQDVETTNW